MVANTRCPFILITSGGLFSPDVVNCTAPNNSQIKGTTKKKAPAGSPKMCRTDHNHCPIFIEAETLAKSKGQISKNTTSLNSNNKSKRKLIAEILDNVGELFNQKVITKTEHDSINRILKSKI